jgi:hypothetical protein
LKRAFTLLKLGPRLRSVQSREILIASVCLFAPDGRILRD